MRKETKRNLVRGYLALFIIFSTFLMPVTMVLAQADDEDVGDDAEDEATYIQTGELIKNFKFESFRGTDISKTNSYAGTKLIFENEPTWTITKDDIELQYTNTQGDRIYFYYKVAARAKINIFTNVPISACAPKFDKEDDKHEVLDYSRYRWKLKKGSSSSYYWKRVEHDEYDMKDYYWDFGNMYSHNANHHRYSGPVVMSFDIDDDPLPDFLTDELGNELEKEFDYIAISSIQIDPDSDVERGKLSDDNPDIQLDGVDFNQETEERKGTSGYDDDKSKSSRKYEINARYGDEFVIQSYDEGIQPMSKGASLNPTTKNGSAIWDPEDEDKSMDDCKFTYNLGRLTPVVFEWGAKLKWNDWDIDHKDYYVVKDKWDEDKEEKSRVRPLALHVHNRYIQTTLKVVFNIWSSYKIEVIESGIDQNGLDKPKEYYDNLTWSGLVEGTESVEITRPDDGLFGILDDLFGGLLGGDWFSWLMIVIFFIVLGVVIYVGIKIVRNPTRRIRRQIKQQQKQTELMNLSRMQQAQMAQQPSPTQPIYRQPQAQPTIVQQPQQIQPQPQKKKRLSQEEIERLQKLKRE